MLSHPDLCVLALTYALSEEGKKKQQAQVEKKQEGDEVKPEGIEPVQKILYCIVAPILITLPTGISGS